MDTPTGDTSKREELQLKEPDRDREDKRPGEPKQRVGAAQLAAPSTRRWRRAKRSHPPS